MKVYRSSIIFLAGVLAGNSCIQDYVPRHEQEKCIRDVQDIKKYERGEVYVIRE